MVRVYPRSHGGTSSLLLQRSHRWGLSPLARGNHNRSWACRCYRGSIPARTGEPDKSRTALPEPGVYPRSHGGTMHKPITGLSYAGLSPLARGNRAVVHFGQPLTGSIPARTGEPDRRGNDWHDRRVYPRSHGGTPPTQPDEYADWGLSPLARGNLPANIKSGNKRGSIPARTGEP